MDAADMAFSEAGEGDITVIKPLTPDEIANDTLIDINNYVFEDEKEEKMTSQRSHRTSMFDSGQRSCPRTSRPPSFSLAPW